MGPTASGKSTLGVRLAKKFGGEIISADSRQVYTGLDIGTGKITRREMRGIPHHLLDMASPKRTSTADDFLNKGRRAMRGITERGRLPILVGGTGFYIDVLTGGITLPTVAPDHRLRTRLEKKGVEELLGLLKKIDSRRARTIEPHHKRRIIRAIEIARALGKNPLPATAKPYDTLWIGIAPSESTVRKNIAQRLRARMKEGMVAEARRLRRGGLSYKRMEALGLEYRSLARFLQKKITREEMILELERDIQRYAKRQMRYWKRNTDIHWFPSPASLRIEQCVHSWLKK